MAEKNKAFERFTLRVNDYKDVFNSEAGRRVLYDLMLKSNYKNSSFHDIPGRAAFNEGRRDVVIGILNMCDYDIDEIHKRIREAEIYGRSNNDND